MSESGYCTEVLSKWNRNDLSVSKYDSHGHKGITLSLNNGDDCTSTTKKYGTNMHLICGQSKLDSISAAQDPKDLCYYNFVIKTNLVCSGKHVSNNGILFGLDWGWISIISGGILLVLIFGIGYIVKSKKNQSWKCKDSFPCYNFCCLLPRYTWVCFYYCLLLFIIVIIIVDLLFWCFLID